MKAGQVAEAAAAPSGQPSVAKRDNNKPSGTCATSTADFKSYVSVITLQGLGVGALVAGKDKKKREFPCVVQSLTEQEVVLAPACPGRTIPLETIDPETFMREFKPSNDRVAMKVEGWGHGLETRVWQMKFVESQATHTI